MAAASCCCGPTCSTIFRSVDETHPFENPSVEDEVNPTHWTVEDGSAEADGALFSELKEIRVISAGTVVKSTHPVTKPSSCRWAIIAATRGNDEPTLRINYVDDNEWYEVRFEATADAPAIAIWRKTPILNGGVPFCEYRRKNEYPGYNPATHSSFELRASLCRGVLLCSVSGQPYFLWDYSGDNPDHDDDGTATYRPLEISIGNEDADAVSFDSGDWALGGTPGSDYISFRQVEAINTDRESEDIICLPDTSCIARGLLTMLPEQIDYTVEGIVQGDATTETDFCDCESLDGSYTAYYAPITNPGTISLCRYLSDSQEDYCEGAEACDSEFHPQAILNNQVGGFEGHVLFGVPTGCTTVATSVKFPVPDFWKPQDLYDSVGVNIPEGGARYCDADDVLMTIDAFTYEASDCGI